MTSRAHRHQRGSAFILALIVIMLLTILGLSLAVVTETEMQLGSTERTIDRQHFAAESGLWAKVAGLILTNEWKKDSLAIVETPDGTDVSGKHIGYAVESSYAKTVVEGCPLWTDCAEDKQSNEFKSSFVLVSSTAQRVGFPMGWASPFEGRIGGKRAFRHTYAGVNDVIVLGQSTVAMGFFVSPLKWQPDLNDAVAGDDASIDGFRQQ